MRIESDVYHTINYEGKDYVRFGPSAWYTLIGESYEPVYHDEELEKEFQRNNKEWF